jgi:hypothetical protein
MPTILTLSLEQLDRLSWVMSQMIEDFLGFKNSLSD